MDFVVLDTETTGLSRETDRIVEIGAILCRSGRPTDTRLHLYINPEREVPDEATKIHGLDNEFLGDKPTFRDVADEVLEFIMDLPLVIHNADFDLGMLNAELARLDKPKIDPAQAIDTLVMARRQFPGAPATLDALCRRFKVDNSGRDLHGALLDAELLVGVYRGLRGDDQMTLFAPTDASGTPETSEQVSTDNWPRRGSLIDPDALAAEHARHDAFLSKMRENAKTPPMWDDFDP